MHHKKQRGGQSRNDPPFRVFCLTCTKTSRLFLIVLHAHPHHAYTHNSTLYNRCLRADPTRCKTAYNLGRLEHECKNFPAALELYRVTLQMNPDDETACSALAYEGLLSMEIFGDKDAAHKCFQESLARNPEHVRSLDHKCALLVMCGKAEEAKKLHDTVRALDPSHGMACLCPYTSSLFSGDLLDEKRPSLTGALFVRAASAPSETEGESSGCQREEISTPQRSSLTKMFKLKVLGSGSKNPGS